MLEVKDFKPDDFDNPIKLLEAISEKQSKSSALRDRFDNYILMGDRSDISGAYTLTEISRAHEIPAHILRAAIESGELKMCAYMPLVSLEDVNTFISERGENSLLASFMYEVQNMRTNYSYKPILLLALLQTANDSGEADIDDIVDYFIGFYEARKAKGLVVEKNDSAFSKYPTDRINARSTIISYPVKVFAGKQFLKYDKENRVIIISPLIWECLTQDLKQIVILSCAQALQKYYDRL